MRTWLRVVGVGVYVSLAVAMGLGGCYKIDTAENQPQGCERDLNCTGGTGTGMVTEECDPAKAKAETGVPATCGYFVSKAGEINSISKALELLAADPTTPDGNKAAIYVCAEAFEEEIVLAPGATDIAGGVTMFGGLDCQNGWLPVMGGRTDVSSPAGTVPLKVDGRWGTTVIHGFRVTAKDAVMPGASSVAVIASGATLSFVDSDFVAGNGMKGADGDPPPAMPAQAGTDGPGGVVACDANSGTAQLGPTNACAESGGPSIGGDSGSGGVAQGSAGSLGVPGDPNAGMGESMGGVQCTPGIGGADGLQGGDGSTPNPSINATDVGVLDAQAGYVGVVGGDGKPGTVGQGGGGGGGARSRVNNMNQCPGMTGNGASGGAGGSGGCGGVGGKGGKPGGSSIGIVSLGATLQLTNSTITTASGAAGGAGALGQDGGAGGMGGTGGGNGAIAMLKAACNGGPGGKGGTGGKGGAGAPGHSIGIAFTGTEPIQAEGVTINTGMPAPNGLKANTQAF